MKDPARFLVEARERVHAFHQGTERWGSRTCRLYTVAVDNTLRELHSRFEGGEDFCLVATGGYARKVLSPYSDVDVLLISSGAADENRLEDLGRAVLYPLWDAGLQVGQRPGTIEEIVASAEDDLAARTALLDLRYVAGSRVIYGALRVALESAVQRWKPDLLAAVRHENLARFAKYGQSVFLLEPHVKEGKGGLRDFHWLGWVGKLEHGLRGDYDMLLSGLVEPEHYRQLIAAHEFLLRVRVQLHLHFGRAQDRLRFEAQEPVAKALGFRKGRGLLAVEHFMGTYYRHAYTMAHLTGLHIARSLGFHWDEPMDPDVAAQTLVLEVGPSAPVVRDATSGTVATDDGLFETFGGTVQVVDPQALMNDPRRILGLFEFNQSVMGRLHHDTMEHVRAALPRINKRFRNDPEVGARFRAILEGPSVFRTLAAMHRSGFLGRYIPEFGACFCQAQHNRVHLYTVDVHSLYVVRELEGLGSDAAEAEHALFARAWKARTRRAPLILAGLLHDIAKSHGSAHSRVGADLAGVILRRMGFEEADVARVQWLVRYHLLLSDTAYHRDLHDPRTMQDLTAVISDRSSLDDLMALTWADTRATNPALMNSWKQALLEQAFGAVRNALNPAEAPDPRDLVDVVRAQVVALLTAEVGRKRAEPLADLVLEGEAANPGYLERTPAPLLATHAALLDQLIASDDEHAVADHVRPVSAQGVSQWIVCTRDRPGVFSMLAGAATAVGLSIQAADAITRADGIVIDTFALTDAQGRPVQDEGRWRRLDRLVGRVFRGETDLQAAVDGAVASARPAPDPGAMELQRVNVTNELSEVATVVEVVTPDRPGLVFEITQVLLEFGLDLRVARIATRHDLASDTFYVVNQRGQPVGKRRRRQLAAVLRERFC